MNASRKAYLTPGHMLKPVAVLLSVLMLVGVACAGGASEEEEPLSREQAQTYFDNIDRLLDQAVEVHEDGPAQAAELVGEAYLENFEHLEHDLEEKDAELNEELEELLGPSFRQAIQDGMSQEELEVRVAEIKDLLDQAKAELGVE